MHENIGGDRRDGVGHAVTGQYGRKGHIAPGECLADTHDVRFDAGVFPGEETARTPEAGGDFVKDEQ